MAASGGAFLMETTEQNVRRTGPESPGHDPGTVMQLLRLEHHLFGELESLAPRQRALVACEDTASLLALLARRQRVSVELSRIGAELKPVRQDWCTYRERFSPEEAAEAERLIDSAECRLRKLIDKDEEDARLLSIRKEIITKELRSSEDTQRFVEAYRSGGSDSRWLDCTDEGSHR